MTLTVRILEPYEQRRTGTQIIAHALARSYSVKLFESGKNGYQGKAREEALANTRKAIDLYLGVREYDEYQP